MKNHWLHYLPECGGGLFRDGTYQHYSALHIKEQEEHLEALKEDYRQKEERLRELASKHWTQDEINKAVIDFNEAKK